MSQRIGHQVPLVLLAAGVAWIALPAGAQEKAATDAPAHGPEPSTGTTLSPLVVVGFRGNEQLDERDAWMPLAIEETLAWRLQRVPGLTIVPTIRTHQARRELAEGDTDPPVEWKRVVRLLGAKRWLRGTCAGTPDALALYLELISAGKREAQSTQTRFGPGRLFEVIDEATRWALSRLGIARISKATEQLIFTPPSTSPSAVEYYAKALAAARAENYRDAAYYVEMAVEADRKFRPALLLMVKIELHASPETRIRAGVHLRELRHLVADARDAVAELEFELNQGTLLLMTGSYDPAQQRFESALANAFERDDIYGQIQAMNSLCDLWLSRQPPAPRDLLPDALQRVQKNNLRRAAEWQELVLQTLRQLGDVIAEAPAANKLALICERLDEQELALRAHKRTIAAAEETGSRRAQATGWMFLGQWYRQQQRWSEALDATQRCLALASKQARPAVQLALGDVYRGMSSPAAALEQYELARAGLDDGDLLKQFRCLRAIAELKMELGERETAIKTLSEALDIAQVLELAEQEALRTRLEQWKSEEP